MMDSRARLPSTTAAAGGGEGGSSSSAQWATMEGGGRTLFGLTPPLGFVRDGLVWGAICLTISLGSILGFYNKNFEKLVNLLCRFCYVHVIPIGGEALKGAMGRMAKRRGTLLANVVMFPST